MKTNKVLVYGLMVLGVIMLLPLLAFSTTMENSALDLIISFEGFAEHPYWDVSRYSWGYGTQAPGSTGTITEEQARAALLKHVQKDYNYLSGLITQPLNGNQWAALLSFSYNLGPGNADNLVNNINAGDNDALGAQWMRYINAGGVPNEVLRERRAAEWAMWNS